MRRFRRRNKGFTLLELMLVVAILVVLAGLATFAIGTMQKSAYSRIAGAEIAKLKDACMMFKLDVGRFPATLDELFSPPAGLPPGRWSGPYLQEPVTGDPWGRPYTYVPDEATDRVIITSNGPDGVQGTADDIPPPTGQQR